MTKRQVAILNNAIEWLETFVKNGGTSAYVNAALSRLEDLKMSVKKQARGKTKGRWDDE